MSETLRQAVLEVQNELAQPLWESKCWGKVWHRFNDTLLNESLLQVNKGFRCSIHYHQYRFNCFINISAVLQIDTFEMIDATPIIQSSKILNAGESLVIKPKVWHCFRVLESGTVAELYWASVGPCRIDDIVRYDIGGLDC